MYIEKVLDLWVQLMKNGGKNKCCIYNFVQCTYIYIYIYYISNRPAFNYNAQLSKKIKINCSTTGILRTIHPTAPTSQTGSSYTHMSQAFPHYCCIYDHTTLYQSLYHTHIIPQQASGSSYEVSVPGGLSSCPAVDMGWGHSVQRSII